MNLTREQILNEPAGWQIDEWIIQYVFKEDLPPPGYWVKTYSAEIEYTWEVIQKLMQEGKAISIECKGKGREYEFTYEIVVADGFWIEAHSFGDFPLAICRAALLTKLTLSTTAERTKENEKG